MNHNNERANQISEARSKLHVRRTEHANTRDVKPGTKPVFAKGHDAVLKGMQDVREMARVCLMSGDIHIGKVVNRDRYTITLEIEGKKRVIYKHAIEFFELAGDVNVGNSAH